MDDSFQVRVDRAFGSLEAVVSSSSIPNANGLSKPTSSSLWCLTDEEIERKEWIRDKFHDHEHDQHHLPPNPKPYSSFLQGFLQKSDAEPLTHLKSDIRELDDDDDDDDDSEEEENQQQPELSKMDNDNRSNEWDIRSSLGMDCTLDNEEEEDAYDQVAVGRDEPADRFYMRSVNDYEVEIDSNNEFPNSFRDVVRDPRANHRAAKLRLKEDDESVGNSVISKDGVHLKSIMRREDQKATESKKQVSFKPGEKGDNGGVIGQSENLMMGESPGSGGAPLSQDPSSVPDYIRNPSKYTHYTFDSLDDVDEESNRKAYMDLFNLLRGSKAMETQDDVSTDSTSIIFTPKKKSVDGSVNNENALKKNRVNGCEEYMQKKAVAISIAAEDAQDSEVCAMDEDELETTTSKSSSLHKAGRRYRTKGNANMED